MTEPPPPPAPRRLQDAVEATLWRIDPSTGERYPCRFTTLDQEGSEVMELRDETGMLRRRERWATVGGRKVRVYEQDW